MADSHRERGGSPAGGPLAFGGAVRGGRGRLVARLRRLSPLGDSMDPWFASPPNVLHLSRTTRCPRLTPATRGFLCRTRTDPSPAPRGEKHKGFPRGAVGWPLFVADPIRRFGSRARRGKYGCSRLAGPLRRSRGLTGPTPPAGPPGTRPGSSVGQTFSRAGCVAP